ncbi:unnamed protein product [Durusdinium trenchii]|uniref:Methyltransferase domain-containing protein n=1 Tax=Durusdinium trenchii TaxID=1381693 RepID=A0ABP0J1C6_9DINO
MFWLALIVPVALLMLLRLFAADVYDAVIVWMTARWYQAVFQRLERGDRILDVGIGTATALVKNKAELLQRRLSVIGIDYEAAYVRKAEAVLKMADLWCPAPEGTEGYRSGEFYCRVLEKSIYDEGLSELCYEACDGKPQKGSSIPEDLRFDAVYFSGSLTVMPDPPAALIAVLPLMKSGGRVFITQTFQKKHSPLMAFIKPLMKYITTIDFGQLTTEEDLERIIARADCFETIENEPISNSINNHVQTARLVILKPKKA